MPRKLDAAAMQQAAQALVGRHDFTTFRAADCQAKSPEKTLERLDVERQGDEVRISAVARSFLHHQVRSMVGSLKLVGEGKWTSRDLAAALAARDRSACGPVAPPDGLYLVRVYPDDSPAGAVQADMLRIVTPSGKVGFVSVDSLLPLANDQLCYVKEGAAWKIAGFLGGGAGSGP